MTGNAHTLIAGGNKRSGPFTAGSGGGLIGYRLGSLGSITAGYNTIQARQIEAIGDVPAFAEFALSLAAPAVAQSFFTGVVVNGVTFLTASASSFGFGAANEWVWTGMAGLVNGGTYNIAWF